MRLNSKASTVVLTNAQRRYPTANGHFPAVDGVSFELLPGELVALVGGSGSGKSTLLNLITGIDRVTAGEVWVQGQRVDTASEDDLARFRAQHVGIVFQFFQLLPTLTALENLVPAMELGRTIEPARRKTRAMDLLDRVGVADQAQKFPDSLSGGQQQRVAIARALANDPELVVADEPTGNLDSVNAREVLMLFSDLARSGKTVLIVTHEREYLSLFQRVLELRDGRILADSSTLNGSVAACIS